MSTAGEQTGPWEDTAWALVEQMNNTANMSNTQMYMSQCMARQLPPLSCTVVSPGLEHWIPVTCSDLKQSRSSAHRLLVLFDLLALYAGHVLLHLPVIPRLVVWIVSVQDGRRCAIKPRSQ